jgi:hypothetical protein
MGKTWKRRLIAQRAGKKAARDVVTTPEIHVEAPITAPVVEVATEPTRTTTTAPRTPQSTGTTPTKGRKHAKTTKTPRNTTETTTK